MNKSIIELKNIAKSFGKQNVLKNINLNVQQGQIVGLIGPSGSGKSTIIKIALGMEVADKGTAEIFEAKMPNRKLLSKIGYMAQTDALYMTLTGFENLKFYAKMKGIKSSELQLQIDHVAEVVDLKDALNKRVEGYSGGMMRRLSLGIALLGNPKLLILDEPTVGIDPALRRKIWRELKRIKNNGQSILITTHVMDEAEQVDEVALILDGNVIALDSPKNLKQQYDVPSIEDVFLKAEGAE
ncbi:ATP-binding cassette domain-containing protein [Pediococcus pentosaceus]|jgi:ABC-2 type transport system ATP-binding protein|uniref:ABC transporter ATP-binding protein n=1 Tax=Pediococcus pentosaceus TaxID=1255 RepID=A0ABD7X5C9_PEDPE|nr:ABC transporter ATP-binding protein [Pediococcus pentosaceus]AXR44124.1 glycosyl transferase family 2 [Pediococcus pentosaceus]KAF0392251.1 ATP-binding cassette domain-containing protein [Pediococcus pentosaceus]KAF0432836.1 ATP-binding cassette domain-containing protein [Pediococcus pentosaceus]KAF0441254.1 ATP-binding cassette domain-containing protein [Pediococcus pentosaceus]KAF0467457.1 ATP-binding cassette domain-containing protein [Pediococcus pentosaceus]